MAISIIFNGNPLTGTASDDFMIADPVSTGTSANTINAGEGDDLVVGDASNTYLADASVGNDSIANAMSLESASTAWTTDENPLFGNSSIPHATVVAESTVGQQEFYSVTAGAGETITIDLDYGHNSPVGTSQDMVVELLDAMGNVLATDDDSSIAQGGLGSFPNNNGSAFSYDPYLSFTVGTAGTYYIRVRPFGNESSTFSDNNTYLLNVSVTGHASTTSAMGADTINGEGGNDSLFGQGGNDTINGGAGDDLIDGGSGSNIVHGDDGNDTIYSGGDGSYYGDAGNDLIYAGLTDFSETLDGGGGNDTLDTTSWNGDYVINMITGVTNYSGESFVGFENLLTGAGNDTITGAGGNNIIRTGAGADTVNAGDGNDTVEGGAGADVLNGQAGINTLSYEGSILGVTVSLAGNSASGGDAAGDTILNFTNLTGSNADDSLTGNGAANVLTGLSGADTLNGAGGADKMYGGVGDDTYYADSYSDKVLEVYGQGNDIVFASDNFVLSDNVEDLTLLGSANLYGYGNGLDNVLAGNSGANKLFGLDGNDVLNGGAGVDRMFGGTGDDTYYVDSYSDAAIENAAEGIDSVFASTNYKLGANVEKLTLQGSADLWGYGNALDNVLTGNSGANKLYGLAGNDTLNGGAGADWLEGGAGQDRLTGGADNDSFVFRDGDFAGLTTSTCDEIKDFATGDKIRLSYMDANTLVSGDQAFSFIGTGAFTSTAGQLRYEQISGNTYVEGDTNGDGVADFMIKLDGLHTMVSGDFGL